MKTPDQVYREEADFLLRENMNKLKGMIDLVCLGLLENLDPEEKEEFFSKLQNNMQSLYQKLENSISAES